MTTRIPHPSSWPIVEQQERAIDRLLTLIQAEESPEQVRSIVNVVAEGAGVPLLALPDDPMEQADFLAIHWLEALWEAGADRSMRRRCISMASKRLRDLLSIFYWWQEETD